MPFVKQLTRIGNSTGIILDRALLQQLDLGPDAEVEISVEKNAIVIRPHTHAADEDVRTAATKMLKKHKAALARLAK